jgi:uncharacterized membrane protein HdeD (DUF308 family)
MTIAHSAAAGTRHAGDGVRPFAGIFLIEGWVLVILGAAAFVLPFVPSLAVANVLGWLFVVGGAVGLVTSLIGGQAPGFWWSLLSALATLAAGALLIGASVGGGISLTVVLSLFLAVDGVLMIAFATAHRRQISDRWGGLMINGIMDLFLAALIAFVVPGAALWVFGLIVAIDFFFGGLVLIGIAMAARMPRVA